MIPASLQAPLIAVVGVALTALVGLYWNFRNSKASRRLPFLQKQLEVCFQTSDTVGRLVSSTDEEAWLAARQRFFELYYGDLTIVAGNSVIKTAVCFKDKLDEFDKKIETSQSLRYNLPFVDGRAVAIGFALSVRNLMIEAWGVLDIHDVLDNDINMQH